MTHFLMHCDLQGQLDIISEVMIKRTTADHPTIFDTSSDLAQNADTRGHQCSVIDLASVQGVEGRDVH